ncbi:MAG: catechol 2,3-dioxygenase [Rhodocyclaceae bacterium]|nr:catechol 2,3-dioxygenase [Rhodocyclaceae bacterium]
MAINGILRPGHVRLRVLDLEEATHHYRDVLGLKEMGRDEQGRVYFKAWDERDHNSLVLREADSAGMDAMAFKVADAATLDRLEAGIREFGISTERIPAGEMLETGERVIFQAPTGHHFELYADKTDVGNGMPYTNPEVWVQDVKGINPVRFDHCLLYGPNIGEVERLFTEVLGFYTTENVLMEDGDSNLAVFMSCSNKAHDIAFVMHPEPGKLHHVSFLLESWEQVLKAADIMSMNRVSIDIGPTRHGITRGTTIYAFDPSGNRFETFSGGYQTYPDQHKLTWTFDQVGPAIFYHDRQLNERFLSVVS